MLFLSFFQTVESSIKEKIILNLEKTNNLTFNFEQKIEDKVENGNCIIDYPKKIFCIYNNKLKKIIVSNGRSLVIKNQINNLSYIYPLKKTPLDLILDKKYLINEIKNLEERIIDKKYINYTLTKNNIKINIFFDINSLYLVGWQTEDIYQNLVITFISNTKFNQKIDQKKFVLPSLNK